MSFERVYIHISFFDMVKYLLLFFMCLPVWGYGQKNKPDKWAPLFEKGEQLVEAKLYMEAVDAYRNIAQTAKRNSEQQAKATYNIGYIYLMMQNDSGARRVFEGMLHSGFNEMDKGGKGEGIMDEPYALYKNTAIRHLIEISLRANEYVTALEYIKLLDKYPYAHFCGNETNAYMHYVIGLKAKAYLGLEDTARALDVLIPLVFDNKLSSNENIVAISTSILKAKYTSTFLRDEINRAIDTMKQLPPREENERIRYEVSFFGKKIIVEGVFSFQLREGISDEELCKNGLRKSSFYRSLTQ